MNILSYSNGQPVLVQPVTNTPSPNKLVQTSTDGKVSVNLLPVSLGKRTFSAFFTSNGALENNGTAETYNFSSTTRPSNLTPFVVPFDCRLDIVQFVPRIAVNSESMVLNLNTSRGNFSFTRGVIGIWNFTPTATIELLKGDTFWCSSTKSGATSILYAHTFFHWIEL